MSLFLCLKVSPETQEHSFQKLAAAVFVGSVGKPKAYPHYPQRIRRQLSLARMSQARFCVRAGKVSNVKP